MSIFCQAFISSSICGPFSTSRNGFEENVTFVFSEGQWLSDWLTVSCSNAVIHSVTARDSGTMRCGKYMYKTENITN